MSTPASTAAAPVSARVAIKGERRSRSLGDALSRVLGKSWGRKTVIGIPYAFLVLFFSLPFLVVLKISVSEADGVQFKDLIDFVDGTLTLRLKLANYLYLANDSLYLNTYAWSLCYAGISTLVCLFIGYPFAYFMTRARPTLRPILVM